MIEQWAIESNVLDTGEALTLGERSDTFMLILLACSLAGSVIFEAKVHVAVLATLVAYLIQCPTSWPRQSCGNAA